jgi:hypothetical protein
MKMFDPLTATVAEVNEYLKQFEPPAHVIKENMIKGIAEMKAMEEAASAMNMTPLEYYEWKRNESR